jgi:ATP-binding cassette subfamily G (WHITE) protein 2 (SNQ2)
LTVRQTLETALKTKTPSKRLQNHRKEFVSEFLDVLTKMYGLTKQVETVVGNAFIRGISGGERKRLSIAEQMATRSSVNMWDGSTRGLDASSALDYAKSLRVQTNLLKKATIVTIYQAVSDSRLLVLLRATMCDKSKHPQTDKILCAHPPLCFFS